MSDPLLGGRTESFQYDLLDKNLDLVAQGMPTFEPGGQLEFSTASTIGGSGSVTWTQDRDVDWLSSYLRVRYSGAGLNEPLITCTVAAPEGSWNGRRAIVGLSLLDTTTVLDEDTYGQSYALAAGTPIVSAVRAIIESTGWTKHAIADSDRTLGAVMIWDADATKLRIVNDLLAAANYWALVSDPSGVLTAERYLEPSQRTVAYEFADDDEGVYLSGWKNTRELYAVPNRVTVVQKTDGDTVPLMVEALLDDIQPRSIFAFAQRGRWRTKPYRDVEGADETTLLGLARRYLIEAQQVADKVEFTHPWLPGVVPNALVGFRHESLGRRILGVVQHQTVKLQRAGFVTSTVRGLL